MAKTDGNRQTKALSSRIRFFWGVEGGGGCEVEQALGYLRELDQC